MEEIKMNNLAIRNMESAVQFFDKIPMDKMEKYLWIPIVGITITGTIVSVIESISQNDYEAQFKIGNLVEFNLKPAKAQVIQ